MFQVLAGRRAIVSCAIVLLAALGLSACGQASSGSAVSGQNLTIAVSAPPSGQGDDRAQDVLAAEKLAFVQSGGRVGTFHLSLDVLRGAKTSDHARTALETSTTIAYLGEILPGESADSLGITGDQGILQVSPTDTAVELTQSTPAVAGAPGIYVETTGGTRFFARVVPTTASEAKALLAAAAAQHVTKLFVASDGLSYGAALAYAVKHGASPSMTVVEGDPTAAAFASSGADGLLYATANPVAAQRLYDAAAARQPSATLLASSALADQQFASSLSTAAQRHLNISSPGFDRAHLTATGQQFTRAFTAAYGHAPAPEAIFGYEAMSALITTLSKAGSNASNRSTVRTDFFAIHNRSSVLGTYSIDADGDTNLAPFVISHVTGGRLTAYRFVSEQG